jgi:hypothetical protein
MSQTGMVIKSPIKPAMPRGPLSSQQQADALKRVQAQAEERVKLGLQLLKASESYSARHREMIEEVRHEQRQMQELLKKEFLEGFEGFEQRFSRLEQRMDGLVARGAETHGLLEKIQDMVQAQLIAYEQVLKENEAQKRRSWERSGEPKTGGAMGVDDMGGSTETALHEFPIHSEPMSVLPMGVGMIGSDWGNPRESGGVEEKSGESAGDGEGMSKWSLQGGVGPDAAWKEADSEVTPAQIEYTKILDQLLSLTPLPHEREDA